MYSGIIYFIFTIFIASALSVAAGTRIGHMLLPSICLSGVVAVFLLVAGVPEACPYVFGFLALTGAVYTAVKIIRDRKNAVYVLTTEFFVFTVFAALCFILNAGRMYILNDEFSHWGLAIKNIFLLKELPYGASTNALFPDYPPFATAISYLGTCFSSVLREDATFIPMDLALAAGIMPVISAYLRACGHKKIPGVGRAFAGIPALGMVVLLLAFKLSAFTVIAVDTLLGVMAFYMVTEVICGKGKSRIFSAMLTGFCLAVTKPTGLIFALFAAGILLVAAVSEGLRRRSFKHFLKVFLSTVLPVVLMSVVAKLLWNVVLVFNKVSGGGDHFGVLVNIIRRGLLPREKEIALAFLRAFTEPRVIKVLPAAAVIAAIAAVNIVVLVILKKRGNANLGMTRAMFIGMWIELPLYCFGLFIAYLSEFSEGEALVAASFERYMGSFLTFWSWLTAAVVIIAIIPGILRRLAVRASSSGGIGTSGLRAVGFTASGLFLAAMIVFFAAFYPYKKADARQYRADCETSSGLNVRVRALRGDRYEKVLLVSSRYDNKLRLITNYNAAPLKVCGAECDDVRSLLLSGEYEFVYFEDGEIGEDCRDLVAKGAALGDGWVYRVKTE